MNYERLLRTIRSHPALWGEHGEAKEKQAERIRDRCIAKLGPVWEARRRASPRHHYHWMYAAEGYF